MRVHGGIRMRSRVPLSFVCAQLAVKMDALRRMQEFKAIQEGQNMLQSGQMRATGTALEV